MPSAQGCDGCFTVSPKNVMVGDRFSEIVQEVGVFKIAHIVSHCIGGHFRRSPLLESLPITCKRNHLLVHEPNE